MSTEATVLDRGPFSERLSRRAPAGETFVNAAVVSGDLPCAANGVAMNETPVLSFRQLVADLIELTKPRIVVMILITTGVAAMFAAGGALDFSLAMDLLLGTALVASSAGTLNQYLEREVDRRMLRTARRPLPAGRISPAVALFYGLLLVVLGTVYLAAKVQVSTAILGLITWASYLLLYTPLKLRTSFNTTVGAVAGALPMLMGYTGGGGSLMDLQGWLLLGVLVAWQYPHFMAIAWLYRKQYGEAGFLMTPNVDPSGVSAGRQAIAGAIALPLFLCCLVYPLERNWLWVPIMVVVSAGLLRCSLAFAADRQETTARRMLRSSLSQLPLAMLVLVLATFFGRT
jgi:protoheme IX farnesyltransferase